jgi:RecA-family ATPase
MAEPKDIKDRTDPFARPVDIGYMLRHPPPPLDHVLPGLLAETIGLVVGPGGVSKTMLALQIGIAMATGTRLLDGLVGSAGRQVQQPARAVLVLAEESPLVVWHRLHAIASVQLAAADIDPQHAAELLQRNLVVHALAGRGQVNLLGETLGPTRAGGLLCRACEGARLVVLDPVRDFHNADENDSTAMKALVRQVASLAAATGAAWLLVHHASRAAALQGYGGSADAGRGSTALTNAVRWQLNLSRPTRESARPLGLRPDELHRHVLLDVPKANYCETIGTMVLARGPHGVLLPAAEAT